MKIEEAREGIGRTVIYTPHDECDDADKEIGVITSCNYHTIYVRYGDNVNSKGTNPEDLVFNIPV